MDKYFETHKPAESNRTNELWRVFLQISKYYLLDNNNRLAANYE